jgi:hypothetical protein
MAEYFEETGNKPWCQTRGMKTGKDNRGITQDTRQQNQIELDRDRKERGIK